VKNGTSFNTAGGYQLYLVNDFELANLTADSLIWYASGILNRLTICVKILGYRCGNIVRASLLNLTSLQ